MAFNIGKQGLKKIAPCGSCKQFTSCGKLGKTITDAGAGTGSMVDDSIRPKKKERTKK
jgi:hypothetical protein